MLNANTYVTNEKGIGGTIRNQYEDFYVEEIPEMTPTGEGPNIWIWIEKVGRTYFRCCFGYCKRFTYW